jgi:hypothetical protein
MDEGTMPSRPMSGHSVITLGHQPHIHSQASGEIVDNCQKAPNSSSVSRHLRLKSANDTFRGVAYRFGLPTGAVHLTAVPSLSQYGFTAASSQATCCGIDQTHADSRPGSRALYFPSYEILNDELGHRYYQPICSIPRHAVDYISSVWPKPTSVTPHPVSQRVGPIKAALAPPLRRLFASAPDLVAETSVGRGTARAWQGYGSASLLLPHELSRFLQLLESLTS